MPDEVRERLRTRVLGGRPTRSGLVGPLAAAAAVMVLVAGALVLTAPGSREDRVGHGQDAGHDAELDRCWAALVDAGLTAGYPDRSEWRGVLGQSGLGGTHVTAALAGDKPIFCQTTPTQVLVSHPTAGPEYDEATDAGPGVLLRTDYGAIGGVVDPAWPDTELILGYADGVTRTVDPQQAEGLFVADLQDNLRDPRIDLLADASQDRLVELDTALPIVSGPPPVVVFDRQGQPAPDAAEDLAECWRLSDEMVTGWEPGASLLTRTGGAEHTGIEVMLARVGERVGVCTSTAQFTEMVSYPVPAADQPPVRLPNPESSFPAILGLVSPDAAYVEVYFGDFSLKAPVVNSTFVLENAGTVTHVGVWDRNHNPLYEGMFAGEG
jgi:hypothetical protein